MSSQMPQSQELFLILHKVRGEPAFDIATNIGDETGDLWIIPTSGHRAYPYWTQPLADLTWNWSGNGDWHPSDDGYTSEDINDVPPMPPDCPDHYSTSPAPRPSIRGIAERLGLIRPSTFTKRAF